MSAWVSLKPYRADRENPRSLEGQVELDSEGGILHFSFRAEGTLDEIVFPKAREKVMRRDEIWKSTCFEVFLLSEDGSYLEVNLGSSGDWNVYRFDSYRSGRKLAAKFEVVLTQFEKTSGQLNLKAEVRGPWSKVQLKQVGLAVIFEEGGTSDLSYWALAHREDRPDFHDLVNFKIEEF